MENLIEHEDEIHSRPKRTWFQSEKQKQESQKKSKIAMFGEELDDNENDNDTIEQEVQDEP